MIKKIKYIIFPIDNYEIRLYSINGDYIVVDCESEMDFETFEKYYKIVLTAYCFITGFAPIAKGYVFGYKHNSCEYDSFICDTNTFFEFNSKLKLINTNVYMYSDDENTQDELLEKLKPISKESISNLTNHMLNNTKFYYIMDIIFDINKIGSFGRSTASLYVVCLEMITSIIRNSKNETNDNHIKQNKNQEAKVRLKEELDCIAREYYKNNIPDECYENSIFKKKINDLLKPTNIDQLRMPFDMLSIKLSEDDLKIIKRCNDLLHGNNIFKSNLSLHDEAKEILYLNFQLNYLVNALILKYIGYSGAIRNLSKIIEATSNLDAVKDEKPYKFI